MSPDQILAALSKLSTSFSSTSFFNVDSNPPLLTPTQSNVSFPRLLQIIFQSDTTQNSESEILSNLPEHSNQVMESLSSNLQHLTSVISQKYKSKFTIVPELLFLKFDFLLAVLVNINFTQQDTDFINCIIHLISYLSFQNTHNYMRLRKLGLFDTMILCFKNCHFENCFFLNHIISFFTNAVIENWGFVEKLKSEGVYETIIENLHYFVCEPGLVQELIVFLTYSCNKHFYVIRNNTVRVAKVAIKEFKSCILHIYDIYIYVNLSENMYILYLHIYLKHIYCYTGMHRYILHFLYTHTDTHIHYDSCPLVISPRQSILFILTTVNKHSPDLEITESAFTSLALLDEVSCQHPSLHVNYINLIQEITQNFLNLESNTSNPQQISKQLDILKNFLCECKTIHQTPLSVKLNLQEDYAIISYCSLFELVSKFGEDVGKVFFQKIHFDMMIKVLDMGCPEYSLILLNCLGNIIPFQDLEVFIYRRAFLDQVFHCLTYKRSLQVFP